MNKNKRIMKLKHILNVTIINTFSTPQSYCLNGLLGKMDSSPNIQLILSLISSFCTPLLCYGIEPMRLNKS